MYQLIAYPEFPNHIYASKCLWKSTYTEEVWQTNVLRVLGERFMGKSTQQINKFSYEYDFLIIELKLTKTKIKTQYLPLAEATRG